MLAFGGIVLTVASVALGLVTAMLTVEILAARKPTAATPAAENGERPAATVLIPAHDEELHLPETLKSIEGQLGPRDQVLVVADNCTDSTAEVGRRSGAAVIERSDPPRRGKGYALQFGLDHLATAPPDVVVALDADCRVAPGAIERLVRTAATLGRPVQGVYLIEAAPDAGLGERLSAFAFSIKNQVRPMGLRRLGLPCPLTGTGMAFPWLVLYEVPLDVGTIVEDMKLGLDLTLAGHPPVLEDRARITSDFPTSGKAQTSQRRRWEHGHLSTIATVVPHLIKAAAARGRPSLLAVAFELMIPPLSLLTILLLAVFVATVALGGLGGTKLPLIITAVSIGLAALGLVVSWREFGHATVSVGELLSIPAYVLRKVPVYVDFIRRRERSWIRTQRGK